MVAGNLAAKATSLLHMGLCFSCLRSHCCETGALTQCHCCRDMLHVEGHSGSMCKTYTHVRGTGCITAAPGKRFWLMTLQYIPPTKMLRALEQVHSGSHNISHVKSHTVSHIMSRIAVRVEYAHQWQAARSAQYMSAEQHDGRPPE